MKKEGKIVLTFVLASFLVAVSLVSAETNFEVLMNKIASSLSNNFDSIQLTPENYSIILLGILLWMVLYSVVKKIGVFKREGQIWTGIIALIITVLTFIWLPKDFVTAIAIPYSATGATILTAIPFLIVIYFTVWVTDSIIVARVIWIVFMVYYFSIIISLIASSEGGLFTETTTPYWIALVMGLIIFVLLRNIRAWVFAGRVSELEEKGGRLVRKAGVGARVLGGAADEFAEGGGI